MTADDIKAHGYALAKQLPSGEWLGVQKMLFTTGLFVITADGGSWRTRYCFNVFPAPKDGDFHCRRATFRPDT